MTARPLHATLLAASLALLALGWAPGCLSAPRGAGVPALPANVSGAGEEYLSSLGATTRALAGVKDAGSAAGAADALRERLPALNRAMDVLGGLQGEAKDRALGALGSRLGRANGAFRAQADRVARDPALSGPLGGLVEQVRLFE